MRRPGPRTLDRPTCIEVRVRALPDERHLALRPATPADVPAIVALHRGLEPAPAPDASPVDWFRASGPWMHEHFCARHIQVYFDLGWDCWVLERNGEAIAAASRCSMPPSQSRSGATPTSNCWNSPKTSMSPRSSTGSWTSASAAPALAASTASGAAPSAPAAVGTSWRRGDTRSVGGTPGYGSRILTACRRPRTKSLPFEGDYDREASHLIALDHRESAAYRWRYLWRPVRTPEIGLPHGRLVLRSAHHPSRSPGRQRPCHRLEVARSPGGLGRPLRRTRSGGRR